MADSKEPETTGNAIQQTLNSIMSAFELSQSLTFCSLIWSYFKGWDKSIIIPPHFIENISSIKENEFYKEYRRLTLAIESYTQKYSTYTYDSKGKISYGEPHPYGKHFLDSWPLQEYCFPLLKRPLYTSAREAAEAFVGNILYICASSETLDYQAKNIVDCIADDKRSIDAIDRHSYELICRLKVEHQQAQEKYRQVMAQQPTTGEPGGGNDAEKVTASRTAPMSLAELARRISGKDKARSRDFMSVLRGCGLKQVGNKYTIRLDPTLGKIAIERLSQPAP